MRGEPMMRGVVGVFLVSLAAAVFSPASGFAGDWSAVSYCKTTGNLGYAYRANSRADAQQVAHAACAYGVVKREGRTKTMAHACCKPIDAADKRCFGIATSLDSRKTAFVARQSTKAKTVRRAMRTCMKRGRFCSMLVLVCGGSYQGRLETHSAVGWGISLAFPSTELRASRR